MSGQYGGPMVTVNIPTVPQGFKPSDQGVIFAPDAKQALEHWLSKSGEWNAQYESQFIVRNENTGLLQLFKVEPHANYEIKEIA